FDRATAAARDLEARYPDHPAGAFYRAVIAYQKLTVEIPSNPETRKQFDAGARDAIALAEALASSAPATSHFYLGAALGFQARALVADGHFAAALGKARRGVRHLREA